MAASNEPRVAVYSGTFDPVTLGHLDVIARGRRLFDRLIVAVGNNPEKRPLFTPEERVALIREAVGPADDVEVQAFEGLAVHFLRQVAARIMLRGVRTLSDMDLEFTMALANETMAPEVETVFLMGAGEFSHISSSLIKQIASMNGEDELRKFVPEPVVKPLLEKLHGSRK